MHTASLTKGIVPTHRLSERELALSARQAAFDLAAISRFGDLRLVDGGMVETDSVEEGDLASLGLGSGRRGRTAVRACDALCDPEWPPGAEAPFPRSALTVLPWAVAPAL